jgi:two-component system, LytTR family, sensor kinase
MDTPAAARASHTFLTPRVFAVCQAAWWMVAFFVMARDWLLVGPHALGLTPTWLILTAQSIVLWGLMSPFFLEAARRLDFERGRRLFAVTMHIAFAVLATLIDVAVDMGMNLIHHLDEDSFTKQLYAQVFINTFSYVAIAGLGYAVTYYRRLADSRVNAAELSRELAQTRLDVLARTLQPHFLFNALNTVAALVRLNENRNALTATVALGDLLRVVLETRGEARVPLARELDFLERYVAIEKLRFEDRLEVRIEIGPDAGKLLVPALILQPLVENAIRHGVEVSGRGRVLIEADCAGDVLAMGVKVESAPTGGDPRVAGLGIGLDVTRRRLTYLYGEGRFTLDLLVGCGHSAVTLRIPSEEMEHGGANPDSHRR